jgi:putative Mg2+ transporter-C (MgtC) family protein
MNFWDPFVRLVLAAGLGAALGLEREWRHKPAGLRTNILIALGSALFTLVSIAIGQGAGTEDRIAAQVVTGIGFLGGGAILRHGTSVRGMTTAATIWVNAAIGMAAGAGYLALATAGAAITLFVLAVLPTIESWVERWTRPEGRAGHIERRGRPGPPR